MNKTPTTHPVILMLQAISPILCVFFAGLLAMYSHDIMSVVFLAVALIIYAGTSDALFGKKNSNDKT